MRYIERINYKQAAQILTLTLLNVKYRSRIRHPPPSGSKIFLNLIVGLVAAGSDSLHPWVMSQLTGLLSTVKCRRWQECHSDVGDQLNWVIDDGRLVGIQTWRQSGTFWRYLRQRLFEACLDKQKLHWHVSGCWKSTGLTWTMFEVFRMQRLS